jgi:hypothetical protein
MPASGRSSDGSDDRGSGRRDPRHIAAALALLVAGLGIELGRLIVARPDPNPEVEELVRLVRRSLGPLDVIARPAGRNGTR